MLNLCLVLLQALGESICLDLLVESVKFLKDWFTVFQFFEFFISHLVELAVRLFFLPCDHRLDTFLNVMVLFFCEVVLEQILNLRIFALLQETNPARIRSVYIFLDLFEVLFDLIFLEVDGTKLFLFDGCDG